MDPEGKNKELDKLEHGLDKGLEYENKTRRKDPFLKKEKGHIGVMGYIERKIEQIERE